jgi:N-carbamoyl-L-amino-acid hydrolase
VLEVRDIDNERKAHAVLELEATFRKIAFEENLQISFETLKEDSSAKLSERLADKLIAAAARMGKRAKRMHSGAAHDGLVTHTAGVETSVVFLPSRDGISHNPEEYTPFESIVDGANLVLDTVLELTKR